MIFIENFKDGEVITGHYLCKQKQLLKSKAQKSYLSLLLADKTGKIDGKVWDLNNGIQDFEEGDMIKIEAAAQVYNSELQLKITRLRKSEEGEYTPGDYVRTTDKDVTELSVQLTGFINTIGDLYIKKLLENIFGRDDVTKNMQLSSAARTLHHAYVGGLIEHTVSVTQMCDFMSSRYKHVNRDILIASAMLHDIEKIRELSLFPENEYTDEGQLIGHIVMGCELITEEAAKIEGFPEKTKLLLKHCILAHHGELEFGSPKMPNIIEAYLLHLCDNFDAKAKAFEEYLTNDKTDSTWIGYNKMLNRYIRKTDL